MIRNRLSVLMGERRVKIADIIEQTGLARATLTAIYYERNKMIAYDTLETLCRYFGIQPGDLLYMKDEDIPALSKK